MNPPRRSDKIELLINNAWIAIAGDFGGAKLAEEMSAIRQSMGRSSACHIRSSESMQRRRGATNQLGIRRGFSDCHRSSKACTEC